MLPRTGLRVVPTVLRGDPSNIATVACDANDGAELKLRSYVVA